MVSQRNAKPTCLGDFFSGGFAMIKVGDTQNKFFKPNDDGPY